MSHSFLTRIKIPKCIPFPPAQVLQRGPEQDGPYIRTGQRIAHCPLRGRGPRQDLVGAVRKVGILLLPHVPPREEEAVHQPVFGLGRVGPSGVVQAAQHDPHVSRVERGVRGLAKPRGPRHAVPEVTPGYGQRGAVGKRRPHPRDKVPYQHVRAGAVPRRGLVDVVDVVVLVVAMEPLGLCARADVEAEGDRAHGLGRVRVFRLAVVVGRGLVDKGRVDGPDQRVDEPRLPGRFAAADEIGTAAGFGWEEVALYR